MPNMSNKKVEMPSQEPEIRARLPQAPDSSR